MFLAWIINAHVHNLVFQFRPHMDGSTHYYDSEKMTSWEYHLATVRKTKELRMATALTLNPSDNDVYQFLCKKRAESKPYYVYMTATANKFLRQYYGKVRECMLGATDPESAA